MNNDTKRFDQERKDTAGRVEPAVQACLCEYYSVPQQRVVSVEHERDGEYQTRGEYRATDLLDYSGVDWLVDVQPEIVPVGERVRPNKQGQRDFSLRFENGVDQPCEADRIPAGLQRGVAPRTVLFGWQSGEDLDRAWLLDTRQLIEVITFGEVPVERHETGDGTAAIYIQVGDLAAAGVVLDSWGEPDGGKDDGA